MWGAILKLFKWLIEHSETIDKMVRAIRKLWKSRGIWKAKRNIPPWKENVQQQQKEEDSVTEAFDLVIEAGVSSEQELSDVMSRPKKDNAVRLPVLLNQLEKINDLQLLSRILDLMSGDRSVKDSVRELFNQQILKQWTKAFCDFATIYNCEKEFKNKTTQNIKTIYQKSLELLGFAIYKFQDIEKEEQNNLALKVSDTFKNILERASKESSELPGQSFQRIVTQIPYITEYITNQELRHQVRVDLANLIPLVLKDLIVRPSVETAPVLMRLCEHTDIAPSELLKFWQELGGDEGCVFLKKIIENTVALEEYQKILKTSPEDAALIALSINKLISECSAICERNNETVCGGTMREYLRYWLYCNVGRLVLENKEVCKRLSEALVAIEQRTNPKRQFLPGDRPLLNAAACIYNSEGNANGKVRHTAKDRALFECTENSLAKAKKLLNREDNQLEFTADERFTKPIDKILECESLRNPNSPKDVTHLLCVSYSKPLSDSEFEKCKKHANGVLV